MTHEPAIAWPSTPSRTFTWVWRTVMLGYLGVACGFIASDGLPIDALVQWRVLTVGVCAGIAGGAAASFWAWTTRPRLSQGVASRLSRCTPGPTPTPPLPRPSAVPGWAC